MKRKNLLLLLAGAFVVMIAFFVLTTAMSAPTTVNITAPKTKASIPEGIAVHLVLVSTDQFYGYSNNLNEGKLYSIDHGNTVRNYLLDMKKRRGDKMVVLIKQTPGATHEST